MSPYLQNLLMGMAPKPSQSLFYDPASSGTVVVPDGQQTPQTPQQADQQFGPNPSAVGAVNAPGAQRNPYTNANGTQNLIQQLIDSMSR